jgi:hypothetical protein
MENPEETWRERLPREIHSVRSETGNSIGPIADDERSCPKPSISICTECDDRGCRCNPANVFERSPPKYRICNWVSLNIHKYDVLADGESLGRVRFVAGISARLKSWECFSLTCGRKACLSPGARSIGQGLFDVDALPALRTLAETMTGAIHFVPWPKPSRVDQFWLFRVSGAEAECDRCASQNCTNYYR